ncbi:hypothetical protein PHYPSEUDO_013687 [Phytophthora pseudosyringae]|uniref:RxLR effector protein n=1 Tax=Phytophthora pseudosyringae TaxID=221518 RepID=A0A8T1W569_9STRA|nr:hypothetical protein PHYPSEUDO_013687 [Phytophthora pseudosyringae]
MKVTSILLAVAVFACGSATAMTTESQNTKISQAVVSSAVQSADAAQNVGTNARRMLRAIERVDDAEERVSLGELMKFDDLTDDIKAQITKLVPKFKRYNTEGYEALDIYNKAIARKKNVKVALYRGRLYETYLDNVNLFKS